MVVLIVVAFVVYQHKIVHSQLDSLHKRMVRTEKHDSAVASYLEQGPIAQQQQQSPHAPNPSATSARSQQQQSHQQQQQRVSEMHEDEDKIPINASIPSDSTFATGMEIDDEDLFGGGTIEKSKYAKA